MIYLARKGAILRVRAQSKASPADFSRNRIELIMVKPTVHEFAWGRFGLGNASVPLVPKVFRRVLRRSSGGTLFRKKCSAKCIEVGRRSGCTAARPPNAFSKMERKPGTHVFFALSALWPCSLLHFCYRLVLTDTTFLSQLQVADSAAAAAPPSTRSRRVSPQDTAGFFSNVTYYWLTELMQVMGR